MEADDRIRVFYDDLGLRIRRGRQRVGMSQADLAARLGLTRTSVANVEAGRQRPAAHQVAMLAELLGLPLAELLPAAPNTLDGFADPEKRQHAELRVWARERAVAAG